MRFKQVVFSVDARLWTCLYKLCAQGDLSKFYLNDISEAATIVSGIWGKYIRKTCSNAVSLVIIGIVFSRSSKMKFARRSWNVYGWAICLFILIDLMEFLTDILSAQPCIERFPFLWNYLLKLTYPFLLFIVKKISIWAFFQEILLKFMSWFCPVYNKHPLFC